VGGQNPTLFPTAEMYSTVLYGCQPHSVANYLDTRRANVFKNMIALFVKRRDKYGYTYTYGVWRFQVY
jgi:hypothetical protein